MVSYIYALITGLVENLEIINTHSTKDSPEFPLVLVEFFRKSLATLGQSKSVRQKLVNGWVEKSQKCLKETRLQTVHKIPIFMPQTLFTGFFFNK